MLVIFGSPGRPGEVALLTAASLAFTLGASPVEATKHLIRAQADRWPR